MVTLEDVERVAGKWLGETDPAPMRAILCAYASHRWLAGDPVWLGLVGGSGVGKTERLNALTTLPNVTLASSITSEGALLSASPRRDRTKEATGGLLRQLGTDGFLVLKDLTTLLSMHNETQSAVFAAFREIYDGRWSRAVGSDGAKHIEWSGRLGLVFGCTTELDRRRAFYSTMGERFLLVRLEPDDSSVGWARANVGREPEMRREMAEVVRLLLEQDHPANSPHPIDEEMGARLDALSILATSARSPVARDYSGQIELVLDRESPNRFVKQLIGLWKGAGLIGLGIKDTEDLLARVALDSIPQLRRQALEVVALSDVSLSTAEAAEKMSRPTRTVHRALEDLEAHGLLARTVDGRSHRWLLKARARWLLEESQCLGARFNHLTKKRKLEDTLYEGDDKQEANGQYISPVSNLAPGTVPEISEHLWPEEDDDGRW